MAAWITRVDPAERVSRRDEHLPPHRRGVDVAQRDPHLQHRVAGLGQAAQAADREAAETGELRRLIGLADHDDTEDAECRDGDRHVHVDRPAQYLHLLLAELVEPIAARDLLEGGLPG